MKRKDIGTLATIGVATAIVAYIMASFLFKAPLSQVSSVPVVPTVSTAFPDVYNDPAYTFFFNKNAYDPTQPVHIGGNNNNQPFQGR